MVVRDLKNWPIELLSDKLKFQRLRRVATGECDGGVNSQCIREVNDHGVYK